jgi:hypothetical protein
VEVNGRENTLVYFVTATIMIVKCITVQAPGVNHIKLFGVNLLTRFCKLDQCINVIIIFRGFEKVQLSKRVN